VRIVDILLFPMCATWFSPTSQCITYDVLKCVSKVVFTSTTLYPISFAKIFAPITYIYAREANAKDFARVQSANVLNNNIIFMYGPIKKLINHTSRLLTWTA
jgi:hypothetical protein